MLRTCTHTDMHDGMLKMDEQAKSILNVNLQLFKKMYFWLRRFLSLGYKMGYFCNNTTHSSTISITQSFISFFPTSSESKERQLW